MTKPESVVSQLAGKAAQTFEDMDESGKVLVIRKPGPLAQFKLIELLGGTLAENRVYVQMVLPLIFLTSIDGDEVKLPKSKKELEALILRLDEAGIAKLGEMVKANFGESAEDAEGEKAALKN